MRSNNLTRKN